MWGSLLSGITGSGGLSTSVSSNSGDSDTKQENPFSYNAAFQVGGSGKQSQTSDQDGTGVGGAASPMNQTIVIAAAAIAGLAVLGLVAANVRRS